MFNSKTCSFLRIQPTIAASPEDYIWRRCLPGTGAKGIQAVERIISAVSRGRQGIAALRIPAVDVATVSDATFRTLNVISLLSKGKRLQTLQQQRAHTIRKTGFQWSPKKSCRQHQYGKVMVTITIYKSVFHSSTNPACCNFPNQKNLYI